MDEVPVRDEGEGPKLVVGGEEPVGAFEGKVVLEVKDSDAVSLGVVSATGEGEDLDIASVGVVWASGEVELKLFSPPGSGSALKVEDAIGISEVVVSAGGDVELELEVFCWLVVDGCIYELARIRLTRSNTYYSC